jgi:hypothetical protein
VIASVLGDPEGLVAVSEEVLDGRIDLVPVVERLAVNSLSRPNFYLGLTTVAAEANEAPWRVRGRFGHDEPPYHSRMSVGRDTCTCPQAGFEPNALIASVLGDPEGFVAVSEEVLDGRIDLVPVVERLAVNSLSRPNAEIAVRLLAGHASEAPWRVRVGF